MPRRVAVEDDWDEDPDDGGPDDAAADWEPEPEDEDETAPCPHCRAPVYEQAERCPACGLYISEEDAPPSRKPGWIVLGLILAACAVYLWVMG